MNCQEALNLLYDFIDKEASEIDTKQVEEHLEKCRDCFEKYRIETEIQNFLNEKFRNSNGEVAHSRLKAKILDQLDALDTSGVHARSKENRRPFRLAATVMVAAASIIVLFGAGSFATRFWTHQTHFIPLEKSHWTFAAQFQDQPPQTPIDLLLADACRIHGYELSPAVGEYKLVSGRMEDLLETTMLHYVYASGKSSVSVFLAPGSWFERYDDDRLEEVIHNNIHFFDHNCRGCRLMFHRMGSTVVVTATSDRSVDLLKFVPGRTVI